MRAAIFHILILVLAFRADGQPAHGKEVRPVDFAKQVAAEAMRTWADSSGRYLEPSRSGDWMLMLAMLRLWYTTGDVRYYSFVKMQVDRLLNKEADTAARGVGEVRLIDTYPGRLFLELYEVTERPGYYRAAVRLWQPFRRAPFRPVLVPAMIVDPYMRVTFRACHAALFHEDSLWDDIAREFIELWRYDSDRKKGSLYHPVEADGYGMALADVLDYFTGGDPERDALIDILRRYAAAALKAQDTATGLWVGPPGNPYAYISPASTVTARFVYMLARGIRNGYLPPAYEVAAQKGWEGVCSRFASDHDPDGMGDIMLAAIAMDELNSSLGREEKTVLLDYYFNNEHRDDIQGLPVRYHYTWEDKSNSGFSLFGHLFRQYGGHTDSLPVAPTAENLAKASVYIIVDPDDEREVPNPHYPGPQEISAIHDWVRAGGVLVLMSNDSANAEFQHFNLLAGTFGIHFNFDDYHKVTGDWYEMGAFELPTHDRIFRTGHRIFIKEMSTLRLAPPAHAHFTDNGRVIMAVARAGRGTVFAIGDPWLYNEYTDGRKLPPSYQNYNAARDLVQWLLSQATRSKTLTR